MPRRFIPCSAVLLLASCCRVQASCSIQKSELHCGSLPAAGPVTLADGQLVHLVHEPGTHGPGAKLCQDKRCKKCLAPGGGVARCSKVALWPVVQTISYTKFALGAVLLVAATALFMFKPQGKSLATVGFEIAQGMLQFASQPWFPWIAAAGTAINMFTIVFTAATVVIFLAAVLARPRSWRSTAIANAVGAAVGSALLLLLLRSQGLELIEERFPTVFNSAAWAKTMRIMESYGTLGMVGVASLPLILHPIIAFGVISGMGDMRILAIILVGRTIKYLTMAYITTTAPSLLKYFGIKESLFEMAKVGAAKTQ